MPRAGTIRFDRLSMLVFSIALAAGGCSARRDSGGGKEVRAPEVVLTDVVDSSNIVTIPAQPACPECSIRLDTAAVLGGHDTISITMSGVLARSAHHDYLVAPIGDYAEVGKYSSLGQLVSVAGREGSAPGEFSNIRSLSMDAVDDSAVVLDRRLTVLSPTLSYVRTQALPARLSASMVLSLPNGNILVNNYGPGYAALCLFERSLELDHCFGPRPHRMDYRRDDMQFNLAAAPGDEIIAVPVDAAYAIAFWTAKGEPVRTLVPTGSPLADPTRDRSLPELSPRAQRPAPRILGVNMDAAGRLWIVGMVADAHWRADPDTSAGHGGEGSFAPLSASDYGRYFDGIVEVLDPDDGRLVVRARVPDPISGITPDGNMWQYALTPEGDLQLIVLKPTVIQPKAKEN